MHLIPKYNTVRFVDVWKEASKFLADCKESDLPLKISDEKCTELFYLLYAKYGNNPIANFDIWQFKYKIFTTIYQYGAEWEKKLEIQDKLRSLSENDIMSEGESIMNHANNPSVAPSTELTEELKYVDDQNVAKRKRSKLEAYQFLWAVLDSNITSEFIKKFESCFSKFADKNIEVAYCSDDDDSDGIL